MRKNYEMAGGVYRDKVGLILAAHNDRAGEIIENYLARQANPNCDEYCGSGTPLITAASCGNEVGVDILLKAGAHSLKRSMQVGRGETALRVARKNLVVCESNAIGKIENLRNIIRLLEKAEAQCSLAGKFYYAATALRPQFRSAMYQCVGTILSYAERKVRRRLRYDRNRIGMHR